MSNDDSARPMTVLVWIAVVAVPLLGGWQVFHMHSHSADQKILIDHSKQ